MRNNKWVPGKHKFECMICREHFLSDNKKIMKWMGNTVCCTSCWDKEPWFMKKLPRMGNELAPVNSPSIPPVADFLSDGVTWDEDSTIWNLDADLPFFGINWED